MIKKKQFSIRFGVKNNQELCSRTWKVWAMGDEVYVLNRKLGHYFKASLHASGNWQISYSSDFARKRKIENKKRHIAQWLRPKNNIADGVTLAFRLLIPTSELRKYTSSSKNSKKIFWIDAPENNYAIEIATIYTTPTVKTTGWFGKNHGTKLLGETALDSNEKLWIVYRNIQLTQLDRSSLKYYKDKSVEASGINSGGGILIGKESDGSRKFMEVAIR